MKRPENNLYLNDSQLVLGSLYADNYGCVYKCVAFSGNEAVLKHDDPGSDWTFFVFKFQGGAWLDRDETATWLRCEVLKRPYLGDEEQEYVPAGK